MGFRSMVSSLFVAAVLAASPLMAVAQTGVAAADAGPFMGNWVVSLSSPMGDLTMNVAVSANGDKVATAITGDALVPGKPDAAEISKTGNALVMNYTGEAGGMELPVTLTFTPDADKMKVKCSIMSGAFEMDGTATKK
jgi:hypothetical protein